MMQETSNTEKTIFASVESKSRMREYFKKNHINAAHLALWAEAEENVKCEKSGHVIHCGSIELLNR